jgi:hypothetical protein
MITTPKLSKPSSTIQAASITGLGMAMLWLIISEFTKVEISPELFSITTAFVMDVVGYFKKENVLGSSS